MTYNRFTKLAAIRHFYKRKQMVHSELPVTGNAGADSLMPNECYRQLVYGTIYVHVCSFSHMHPNSSL